MQVLFVFNDAELGWPAPVDVDVEWAIDCKLVDALLLRWERHVDELCPTLLACFSEPLLEQRMRHLLKWRAISVAVEIRLELLHRTVQRVNILLDNFALPLFG
jgi:hypothetical protein